MQKQDTKNKFGSLGFAVDDDSDDDEDSLDEIYPPPGLQPTCSIPTASAGFQPTSVSSIPTDSIAPSSSSCPPVEPDVVVEDENTTE